MNQESNANWDRERLQAPHSVTDKKQRVQRMFSQVARTYDRVNHVISFNMDRRWRRLAVREADVQPGQRVLDLCCGTGDMALTFARRQPGLAGITGVDFVAEMLEQAKEKSRRWQQQAQCNGLVFDWVCADAENVPLEDAGYDRASCVFGIRNLQDPQRGLAEMYRLLKPGGRVVILEFDLPRNPVLRWGYQAYFRHVLPLIGTLLSRDRGGAYRYLPESVAQFNTFERVTEWLGVVGFERIRRISLNFGTVLLFLADKP